MGMKTLTFASLLVGMLLAGCAAHPHAAHHEGGAPMGHDHAAMDPQSMCAMHQQMFAGKSAAERQALIDEHMKAMTPEMRQHMQVMLQACEKPAGR